ncbi:MAG: Uma2 family endonuclease, partial [Gemmatimonadota bacterium]
LEEYRALLSDDGWKQELAAGRLLREPRPGASHGAAVALLSHHLVAYAREHGGRVLSETGFLLEEDPPTVRAPDVSYLREDPEPYGAGADLVFPRGAPDLAVEVVSPANSAADIQRRVLEYFGAGAHEVWVLYPETRTIIAHRSSSEARLLRPDDDLTSDLLSRLRLPVRELFR